MSSSEIFVYIIIGFISSIIFVFPFSSIVGSLFWGIPTYKSYLKNNYLKQKTPNLYIMPIIINFIVVFGAFISGYFFLPKNIFFAITLGAIIGFFRSFGMLKPGAHTDNMSDFKETFKNYIDHEYLNEFVRKNEERQKNRLMASGIDPDKLERFRKKKELEKILKIAQESYQETTTTLNSLDMNKLETILSKEKKSKKDLEILENIQSLFQVQKTMENTIKSVKKEIERIGN